MTKLAQSSIPLGNLRGEGSLGLEGNLASDAPGLLNSILSTTLSVLTMIAAVYLLIQIIIGAYGWMTAGGDKAAIEEARKKIQNGLIGFVIVVAAIFLLDLVGYLLRIPFITDPGAFIRGTP